MAHNPHVYLDIEIEGDEEGRIIIELFADKLPITCESFRALCTGEKGKSKKSEYKLHFKSSKFHRIIPHFMVQSGDFTTKDGYGGEHIYEDEYMKDEGFFFKHDKPGMLSLANDGKNHNKSQFFITTGKASHLDGKHVVFGRVVKGMSVVGKIEDCGGMDGVPTKECIISDCGQLNQREINKVHMV
ncbi:peptidyl-prolyl cis-trans isomerase [Acrasis kona]|uniref:Peptidyl-prolyl cis-trans isomerase n=1 Tax=Acrasis kona TaxID=1008807 RepID=A0AAW2ZMG4_9EUKA